ncbi:predicted protein [Sclerotinia sclerotiorum 1980 UF-70]|uniref:Uncharacterized protein n=1 Tax=Sclerotinia sclerotiorum (strain ATCC 18683 / 1980 / Ss-1) TaxID=665079 RepID=A7E4B1_SCLS1|nr:predicted protein [Sclerotinia sclerotiorum 1980 UF-70]EDN90733.1 predicted protein [Sclerotinia sclerotiorum 1980 UF-70]
MTITSSYFPSRWVIYQLARFPHDIVSVDICGGAWHNKSMWCNEEHYNLKAILDVPDGTGRIHLAGVALADGS